jgi:hypothetical protein
VPAVEGKDFEALEQISDEQSLRPNATVIGPGVTAAIDWGEEKSSARLASYRMRAHLAQ